MVLSPGRVGGRDLGLAVVGVAGRVGAAVLAGAAEPALGVVGEVLLRAVGIGDRQQGVGRLGVAAGVVGVGGRQVARRGHREQMAGRVVGVGPVSPVPSATWDTKPWGL